RGARGIATGIGANEAKGLKRYRYHAEPLSARDDLAVSGQFRVFDLQRGVLALQERLALERPPDRGVQLEQSELQGHDPDQREGDQADPDLAADQAIHQTVLREALEGCEQAKDNAAGALGD